MKNNNTLQSIVKNKSELIMNGLVVSIIKYFFKKFAFKFKVRLFRSYVYRNASTVA